MNGPKWDGRVYEQINFGGGGKYGYDDGWQSSRLFFYTGEGQRGDMRMAAGNNAIASHVASGKDLHLFEQTKKSYVRYVGQFVCCGYHERMSPDIDQKERKAFVFELAPIEILDQPSGFSGAESTPDWEAQLAALRNRALIASTEKVDPTERLQLWRKRSAIVREYVLRRAGGICEGCGQNAPFVTSAGEPYLEPHHIRRLSDGGPDNPQFVAAVCANCHRRAHYSRDAMDFNDNLGKIVSAKEKQLSVRRQS